VFKGGTALRLCRGGQRFSQDMDFALEPGAKINVEKLGSPVEKAIRRATGLDIEFTDPKRKANGTVGLWATSELPSRLRNHPKQRVKLDINTNEHNVLMGEPCPIKTPCLNGLALFPTPVVPCSPLQETLTDKLIAFPQSLARQQYNPRFRDLWDINWIIERHGVSIDGEMLRRKSALSRERDALPDLVKETIARLPGMVSLQGEDERLRGSWFTPDAWDMGLGDSSFQSKMTQTLSLAFDQVLDICLKRQRDRSQRMRP